MREMIRIRHAYPAFGRGEIRFLEPANRAVLAYLRTYEGQTILCVNNLASKPVTLELDLAAWAGALPVDLFARHGFAAVTTDPYRFELSKYQYHWLQLLWTAAAIPALRIIQTECLPDFNHSFTQA
jgi:maltose alpha-D-glucosyltransferase/alpha-amylase